MPTLPFYLATFLGAFLVFEVQFILAKAILPWFGGAAAVWTTCVLFFQVLLLLGYGYSHVLVSSLGPARQRAVHGTSLVLAALAIAAAWSGSGEPLLPGSAWKPGPSAAPVPAILGLLAVHVGLPFLVLAATAPLVQAWFGRAHPGRSPYPLYAISNAGSLSALVAYPFLVEPALGLEGQARCWTAGFVVFAAACLSCATRAIRAPSARAPSGSLSAAGAPEAGAAGHPGLGTLLVWILLSAFGAILLLAVTNQICQDLAVVPFLWVVPLAIYLSTFIVSFRAGAGRFRSWWTVALILSSAGACVALAMAPVLGILAQVGLHCFALLAGCMVCHGELARSRPEAAGLTRYYLAIALGGALGGAFVGVLAPLAFDAYIEYPIGLWGTVLLALVAAGLDRGSWLFRTRTWTPPAYLAGLLAALLALQLLLRLAGKRLPDPVLWTTAIAAVPAMALTYRATRSRRPFASPFTVAGLWGLLLILLGLVLREIESKSALGALLSRRNFYGRILVVAVDPGDGSAPALELRHGRTIHGRQSLDPDRRGEPTTYFGARSGIGLALAHHPRRLGPAPKGPLRIGVIGLGVGTLAAYCGPGDSIRFYELDPDVLALSREPNRIFTYLADCRGEVSVEVGDARLALERELATTGSREFDVLAIDAFSGDSIPVHLLTREAFEIYRAHLRRPDGVLAFHVSNRFLDLRPIVRALGDAAGMESVVIGSDDAEWLSSPSRWHLLSPTRATLDAPEIREAASPPPAPAPRPWTDRRTNLLDALEWR